MPLIWAVQSGAYTASLLGLEPLTQYYFTAYAQNTLGSDWASGSLSFITTEMPPLQINEFMADNATTLTTRVRSSTDQPFRGDALTPDWIELHNPTGQVADLGGYYLTDDLDDPLRVAHSCRDLDSRGWVSRRLCIRSGSSRCSTRRTRIPAHKL